MFLAAKGGHNNESHNHNDVGSFILAIDNLPVMIDVGVGTYTRKTFSRERYSIWTMQSNYHNLPIINGQPEVFGASYKAGKVSVDKKQCLFTADIAQAYPAGAAIDAWLRSYQLKNNSLIVTDDFTLKEKKAANQLNFMTWGEVDTSKKGRIRIRVNGVSAVLNYDDATFTPAIEKIDLTDPRLSKVWGDAVYRITLTAKEQTLKGTYRCTISRENH